MKIVANKFTDGISFIPMIIYNYTNKYIEIAWLAWFIDIYF